MTQVIYLKAPNGSSLPLKEPTSVNYRWHQRQLTAVHTSKQKQCTLQWFFNHFDLFLPVISNGNSA